ncbi:hypothetical protein M427DRAFT_60498 [Gonapodya prolifera JEL478]|uniref:RING-type E3 ubiquitin transferase n=1 Tax=Gonapodya prolifera (strain JEL478) TaxID=1344416 RepID=A0A139A4B5_GONPJ|nr:hypothetical protein M427DRAFT_60498 [Gonapodya prolifera JEL478]|eukprot:KXS11642.1 hypothetical protein M427DRAFT_60498 [Gonapodya prolifera JEL478]
MENRSTPADSPVSMPESSQGRYRYLCYNCNSITEKDSRDPICSSCGSDFVEENPSQDIEDQFANADGDEDDHGAFDSLLTGRLPLGGRPTAAGEGDEEEADGEDDEHLPGEFPSGTASRRRNRNNGEQGAQTQSDIIAATLATILRQYLGSNTQVQVRTLGPDGRPATGAGGSAAAMGGSSFSLSGLGGPAEGQGPPSLFAGGTATGGYAALSPLLAALFSDAFNGGTGGANGNSLFHLLGGVGNPADYAHGRQLDDIVTQLMEEAARQQAPPPAPQDAINALPKVTVTTEMLDGDGKSDGEKGSGLVPCAVCQDSFKVGDVVDKMPCDHVFHGDCLESWLKINGTCPVCRYRLTGGESASAAGTGGGERNPTFSGSEQGQGAQ